jgi:hypothetical protein
MNDFKPSQDFVFATMKKISAYEKSRIRYPAHSVLPALLRHSIPAGGILFTIFNLLRLYFAVYKPVFCF